MSPILNALGPNGLRKWSIEMWFIYFQILTEIIACLYLSVINVCKKVPKLNLVNIITIWLNDKLPAQVSFDLFKDFCYQLWPKSPNM